MRKEFYRTEIERTRKYVNLTEICKAVGISRNSLYLFLRGIDGALSEESLKKYIDFVSDL